MTLRRPRWWLRLPSPHRKCRYLDRYPQTGSKESRLGKRLDIPRVGEVVCLVVEFLRGSDVTKVGSRCCDDRPVPHPAVSEDGNRRHDPEHDEREQELDERESALPWHGHLGFPFIRVAP
jgi:hypothetical protein